MLRETLEDIIATDGGRLAVTSADAAYSWCAALTASHYENFPVASVLLPANMRPHIAAVYAFARYADDAADEPWTTSGEDRLRILSGLASLIDLAASRPHATGNPILVALSHTMAYRRLSPAPFHDLLEAFRRDVQFRPPQSWEDVIDYCGYSANPVGRLVLQIAGIHSRSALAASDSVCTALQLVNFWQDLSVDVPRGRCYIPTSMLHDLGRHGALAECFRRTHDLFQHGLTIRQHVPLGRLRIELQVIARGGMTVLRRCEELEDACWSVRPTLRRSDYLSVMFQVVLDTIRPAFRKSTS
jgi:squalene synthase HpnC